MKKLEYSAHNLNMITSIIFKKERKALWLTQLDLAKKAGYKADSIISLIESGKERLSLKTVLRICEALRKADSNSEEG